MTTAPTPAWIQAKARPSGPAQGGVRQTPVEFAGTNCRQTPIALWDARLLSLVCGAMR